MIPDKMDRWQHDKPALENEQEKDIKHLLKKCKSLEELAEKLGYDPDRYEVDLQATVQEKNLKAGIVVVKDKLAHNREALKQWKEFQKRKQKALPQDREKMKFEFKPPVKRDKHGRVKKKKVKYPKCFGNDFGSYKCKGCSWAELCERKMKEE